MDTTVTRYRTAEVTPSASRSIVPAVPPRDEGLHDHELMALLDVYGTQATRNFTSAERRSMLLNPGSIPTVLNSKRFRMSQGEAMKEILNDIPGEVYAGYLQLYLGWDMARNLEADQIRCAIGDRHTELWNMDPEYRQRTTGDKRTKQLFEAIITPAVKRIRIEEEERAKDFAIIEQNWGEGWLDKLDPEIQLGVSLAQRARMYLKRASKIPESSPAVFGGILRLVVERRKDSGPTVGGFKRYTAGPADIKSAVEEYMTARTAVSATPTPIVRRIVPRSSAGFSVGFPIPHQPFVTTSQIEGEPASTSTPELRSPEGLQGLDSDIVIPNQQNKDAEDRYSSTAALPPKPQTVLQSHRQTSNTPIPSKSILFIHISGVENPLELSATANLDQFLAMLKPHIILKDNDVLYCTPLNHEGEPIWKEPKPVTVEDEWETIKQNHHKILVRKSDSSDWKDPDEENEFDLSAMPSADSPSEKLSPIERNSGNDILVSESLQQRWQQDREHIVALAKQRAVLEIMLDGKGSEVDKQLHKETEHAEMEEVLGLEVKNEMDLDIEEIEQHEEEDEIDQQSGKDSMGTKQKEGSSSDDMGNSLATKSTVSPRRSSRTTKTVARRIKSTSQIQNALVRRGINITPEPEEKTDGAISPNPEDVPGNITPQSYPPPDTPFQDSVTKSPCPSLTVPEINFGLEKHLGVTLDAIIPATSSRKRPVIPEIKHMDFEAAITKYLGEDMIERIKSGEIVNVPLNWFGCRHFTNDHIGPVPWMLHPVWWQVSMYELHYDGGNTNFIGNMVHSAIQQASRQDLVLWMLATWLWKDHEVVTLPIPATSEPPYNNLLFEDVLTAQVCQNRIRLPWCNIQWQPVSRISQVSLAAITRAHMEGGAVFRTKDGFVPVQGFQDEYGILFSHPHPISQALLGYRKWNSPDVVSAMVELLDPQRIKIDIAEHGRIMAYLTLNSAIRSLWVDFRLGPDQSLLSHKVRSLGDGTSAGISMKVVKLVCRGVLSASEELRIQLPGPSTTLDMQELQPSRLLPEIPTLENVTLPLAGIWLTNTTQSPPKQFLGSDSDNLSETPTLSKRQQVVAPEALHRKRPQETPLSTDRAEKRLKQQHSIIPFKTLPVLTDGPPEFTPSTPLSVDPTGASSAFSVFASSTPLPEPTGQPSSVPTSTPPNLLTPKQVIIRAPQQEEDTSAAESKHESELLGQNSHSSEGHNFPTSEHLQQPVLEEYHPTEEELATWSSAYKMLEQWNEEEWPSIAKLFRHDSNIRFMGGDQRELVRIKAPGMIRTPFIHQAAGVHWWLWQEAGPFGAGLVGDEMGLGKTTLVALATTTSAKLFAMESHRKANPADHRPEAATCALESRLDAEGNYVYPVCPCGGGVSAEHRGREGATLFLVPPGNVEGLAKDIRNASDFLSVHCERAAFTGSPPQYIPVDTINKQTPEDIARTIIVCSKSCFLTRYFKSGNLFRGRKGALLTAYDISRTNTSSLNARSLIPIARIVVDEAHLIRNASSAFLHCLQMAPCPVWFMTGSAANLSPKDILGFVNVWQWSNKGAYMRQAQTAQYRHKHVEDIRKAHRRILQLRMEEPSLPASHRGRTDELRDLAFESRLNWEDEPAVVRHWLNWYKHELDLQALVEKYTDFCSRTMIIRTNTTSIWGERLIQLPPTEHQEIYLEFLDDTYRRAYSEEFQRAKDEVAAVFRYRGNAAKGNYLSLFRKSRISASIPILGLDPEFREMALTTEECRQSAAYSNECPFGKHLDEIVASSKKLQWLQNFIKNLGTVIDPDTGYEYPEKVVIFAGVPVVAYIIWLSLRAVVPTPELPDSYDEPIKLGSQESNYREQVKLVYGPNKSTREDTVARFSDNLFEARVMVGTYACMAESFNLIRAARVVLFQPDWLVLSEEQAKARVWRCGQTRTTLSYRLLTTDSVDVTMAERQAQGAKFNQAVLGVPLEIAEGGSESDDEDYYY